MDYISINNLEIQAGPKLIFEPNLDLGKGTSNRTYEIQIPNTSINNKYLDNLFSKYVNRSAVFQAKYIIEGLTLIGLLTIKNITEYEATAVFVTGNESIWEAFKQDSLQQIDLDHRNIVLTKDNVINSETGTPFILFDLVDRGAFKELEAIDVSDRFPAVNIEQLLHEIFNYYGLGLSITDNYGDFKDLYLLFTQNIDRQNLLESFAKATGNSHNYGYSSTGGTFSIEEKLLFNNVESDLGSNFEDSVYTVPKNGAYETLVNYNLRFEIPQEAVLSNSVAKIAITKSGETQVLKEIGVDLSENYYSEVSGTISLKPLYMEEGETLEAKIIFTGNIDYQGTWQISIVEKPGHSITFKASENFGTGELIKISEILPKEIISTFLKNLFSLLNIDVYFNTNTTHVELVFGNKQSAPTEILTVWDYKEFPKNKTDRILKFATDKASPLPNKIIKIQNSREVNTIDLPFSRTLKVPCARLFLTVDISIPTMWQVGNPLNPQQFLNPPKQSTKGNLRILKKAQPKDGNYILTYSGSSISDRVFMSSVLQLEEPNFRELHIPAAAREAKIIECYAKLDFSKLHNNEYFKKEVVLKSEDTGKTLLNGVIIRAEQIGGNIYKLTLKPTALDLIDTSIVDFYNPASVPDISQSQEFLEGETKAVWGLITGSIEDQTDLQEALDEKEDFIEAGTTNQYYSWNKTFKQIDYSEIGGTFPHPTGFSNQPTSALTGTSVISQLLVNTYGHITGVSTRNLSVSDIGAAAAVHSHGNITSAGYIGSEAGNVLQTGTGGIIEAKIKGLANQFLNGLGSWAVPPDTITRVKGTGGTLVTGDITIQGSGKISTSQSGNVITIASTDPDYVHPTGFVSQPETALSGASVISKILVNNEGHLTGVISRTLTLGDLNAQELIPTGQLNQFYAWDKTFKHINYSQILDTPAAYVHPTGFSNAPTNVLSGANVISRILLNTNGHVTGVDTRALTVSDIGAAPLTHSHGNISVDGKIGTIENLVIITKAGGALDAKVAGTSNQFLNGVGQWQVPQDTITRLKSTTGNYVSGDITLTGSGSITTSQSENVITIHSPLYSHPGGFSDQPVIALSGARVISQVLINQEGHTTGVGTRDLTYFDIGAQANITSGEFGQFYSWDKTWRAVSYLSLTDIPNPYEHPTGFLSQPELELTGASVISKILVNTNGHLTGLFTRNITPANIGASSSTHVHGNLTNDGKIGDVSGLMVWTTTGGTLTTKTAGVASQFLNGLSQWAVPENTVTRVSATGGIYVSGDILIEGTGTISTSQVGNTITISNSYTHPTGFSNQPAINQTGASVISQILVNSNGHVTGASVRNLTPADIGAQINIANGTVGQYFSWDKTWRTVSYNELSGTPTLVAAFADLSDTVPYTSADALKFVRVNSTYNALEYAALDLSGYQPLIEPGVSPQYYAWDKTFKRIQYSEIENTPSGYVHPTGFTSLPTTALTGASVITKVEVNTEGHLTGILTRELNPANIGASPNTHVHGNITNSGKIGELSNLILWTTAGGLVDVKAQGLSSQFLNGLSEWATPQDTVTRLQATGGSLVHGDILIQGNGIISTSQSGNTITITATGTNYNHPNGFISQPEAALTGPDVISQVLVNDDGHVIGASVRSMTYSDIGAQQNITPGSANQYYSWNKTFKQILYSELGGTQPSTSKWTDGISGTTNFIQRNGTVVIGASPSVGAVVDDTVLFVKGKANSLDILIQDYQGNNLARSYEGQLYIDGILNIQKSTGFRIYNGTYYTEIRNSATGSSNLLVTLPNNAGTNGQLLSTNGSGVLSWVSGVSYSSSNVGAGARVYKETVGTDFKFRTIVSSDSTITITENLDTIDLKVPSIDLSNYVTLTTSQSITGAKHFENSGGVGIRSGGTGGGGHYFILKGNNAANSYYGGTLSLSTLTNNRQYYLPDKTGTIAMTSDIPSAPDLSAYVTLATSQTITGNKIFQNAAGLYIQNGALLQILPNGVSGSGTINNQSLTATRIWTLPDKSGTFAMTSDIVNPDLSNYVDKTSTQDISGFKHFTRASFKAYSNLSVKIVHQDGGQPLFIIPPYNGSPGTYTGTLGMATLTANRTWSLPDESGTIATTTYLNTQIASLFSSLVTIATAQTITGQKSFQQIANFPSIGLTYGSAYKTVIQASTLTGNTLFQLPPNNGTNGYVLTTNGSGVTSWTSVSQHWTLVSSSPVNHIIHTGAVVIGSGTPTLSDTTGQLHIIGNADNVNTRAFVITSSSNKLNFQVDNRGNAVIGGSLIIGRPGETNSAYKGKVAIRSFNSAYSTYIYASDELAANYNLTLPTTAGTSGYVLTTDGTGVLSWSPNGAGSYNIFSLNTNGLVPGPSAQNATTFLASDGNWYNIAAGVTTSLKVSGGTPRVGDLTLIGGDGITVTNSSEFAFTISHADTSSITATSTSDFNIISSLNFDTFGHVIGITTRSLLPSTSGGLYLRDDGWAALPQGTAHDPVTLNRSDRYITLIGQQVVVGLVDMTSNITGNLPVSRLNNGINANDMTFWCGDGTWKTAGSSYNLQLAASGMRGGLQVGFTATGASLPLLLSDERGYVTLTQTAIETALVGNVNSHTHNYDNYAGWYLSVSGVAGSELIGKGQEVIFVGAGATTISRSGKTITISSVAPGGGEIGEIPVGTNTDYLRSRNSSGDPYWKLYTASESLTFSGSLQDSSGTVTLVNDSSSPGISKYYGTNISGTKGWHSLPEFEEEELLFKNWVANSNNIQLIFGIDGAFSLKIYDNGVFKYDTNSLNLYNYFYDKNKINDFFSGTTSINGYNKSNWDAAYSWGPHSDLYLSNTTYITINGSMKSLATNPVWSVGTVTSVNVGVGLTLSGSSTVSPTLYITSHAGTAGVVGKVVVGANSLGVELGSTSTQAAPGNHTHSDLHPKRHALTSSADHYGNALKMFYSDIEGNIRELSFGGNDEILTSLGTSVMFKDFYSFNVFSTTTKGLVPQSGTSAMEGEETRFLRADGQWAIPTGTGQGMANPMTSIGDIIIGSTGGSPSRLGATTNGYVLTLTNNNGTTPLTPVWAASGTYTHGQHTGDVSSSGTGNLTLTLTSTSISSKPAVGTSGISLDLPDYMLFSDYANGALYRSTINQFKSFIFSYNTDADLKTLTSYSSGNQTWTDFKFIKLTDTPASPGTNGQLLKWNNYALINFNTVSLFSGTGITLSNNSYNPTDASSATISVNFDVVAAKTHSHQFSDLPNNYHKRLVGIGDKGNDSATYPIQWLTIAAGGALKMNDTSLEAKLYNETSPTLNANLNVNSKDLSSVGTVLPSMSGSTAIKDLGSAFYLWKHVYTRGTIWISTANNTYYAGNAAGSAKFNDATVATLTASASISLGSWKFELINGGADMKLSYNGVTKFEFYNNGNMKFFET